MPKNKIDLFINNIRKLNELTNIIDDILKKIQKEFEENEFKMYYHKENNIFYQIQVFNNVDNTVPNKEFKFNYLCYLNQKYDEEQIKNEFYDLVNKQFGFD